MASKKSAPNKSAPKTSPVKPARGGKEPTALKAGSKSAKPAKPVAAAMQAAKAAPPAAAKSAKPSAAAKNAKSAKPSAAAKNARSAKPSPVAKSAPAAPAAAKKSAAKPKRPNAVVHWEIQSKQPEVLHAFYTKVFGWNVDANNPMNYGMVASRGERGIDGGIGGSPDTDARLVVYASVQDIPAVLKRIEQLGGRTLMPRTDIGPVIMALYRDPEGHTMGLIEDA